MINNKYKNTEPRGRLAQSEMSYRRGRMELPTNIPGGTNFDCNKDNKELELGTSWATDVRNLNGKKLDDAEITTIQQEITACFEMYLNLP